MGQTEAGGRGIDTSVGISSHKSMGPCSCDFHRAQEIDRRIGRDLAALSYPIMELTKWDIKFPGRKTAAIDAIALDFHF